MSSPVSPSRPPAATAEADKATLHQFGYAQQLLRDMGGFSNFAISFSIISILTGAVTLYGVGLNAGGPVVMGIGWPLVTLFVLFVAAALAELASAIPTSGALYHWASVLGGPGWGWMTAWLNLVGLVAAIAGIDYGCAEFVVKLAGWEKTPAHVMPVFGAIVLSHAVLNHTGIRVVARLNDFSAIYHVAGVAVVIFALAFFASKRPFTWLFTETFTTVKDQPYWFAFLGGLLQAQWTYTGFDASAHTIEETRNARVSAPWGIYLSVAVSGLFGWLMLAFVTLAIKDLPAAAGADVAFIGVLEQALGKGFGNGIAWMIAVAMWFCGLSCVTSTSRMIFAFARDGGLPGSKTWAHVSRRWRTPAAAVWLAGSFAFLLVAGIFAVVIASRKLPGLKPFEFTTVYVAVTGISTIGLYLSYGIPLLLKLIAVRRGLWTSRANGPWTLGRWSGPVNVVALLWIAFITVLFVLPPNDLTGWIFAGTVGALLTLYFATAHRRFRGPVPQAHSAAELLKLEAEFEK
jgi:amino acid transporter